MWYIGKAKHSLRLVLLCKYTWVEEAWFTNHSWLIVKTMIAPYHQIALLVSTPGVHSLGSSKTYILCIYPLDFIAVKHLWPRHDIYKGKLAVTMAQTMSNIIWHIRFAFSWGFNIQPHICPVFLRSKDVTVPSTSRGNRSEKHFLSVESTSKYNERLHCPPIIILCMAVPHSPGNSWLFTVASKQPAYPSIRGQHCIQMGDNSIVCSHCLVACWMQSYSSWT